MDFDPHDRHRPAYDSMLRDLEFQGNRVSRRKFRRTRRSPAKRLAGLALSAAMVAAGAFAIHVALDGGPGNQMTGGATQIPSSVLGSAPRLASLPTAAPLSPSQPLRIEIPALDVNAPVMRLGQDPDGAVQVPPLGNHNLAGWYDRTVLPGQDGTSVILGHVDNFTGPSVFFYIKTLRPGDILKVVRADGKTAEFSVDGVQRVAKVTFPSQAIYGNTRYPGLRLITCGGPFDSSTRQYVDNIIVYSHLIN